MQEASGRLVKIGLYWQMWMDRWMDSKTLHQQAAMIITYLLTLFMYLFVRLFAMLSLLSLCTYVIVCRG